jgi:hypothetical protein
VLFRGSSDIAACIAFRAGRMQSPTAAEMEQTDHVAMQQLADTLCLWLCSEPPLPALPPRCLASLTLGKYKVLAKSSPEVKRVTKEDKFSFNSKFTDKMARIKVPLPPVDEKKKVSGKMAAVCWCCAAVCKHHRPCSCCRAARVQRRTGRGSNVCSTRMLLALQSPATPECAQHLLTHAGTC